MTTRRKPSKALTKILASIDEDKLRRTRERMLVACKIADTLKVKGLTQKEFAKMLGKSESEISEYLSGNRNFTFDTLSDMAHSLGIDLFPLSFIPTKRVSKEEAEVKLPKTRKATVYDMGYIRTISQSFGAWRTYPTSSCLSLAI
ncbi:MAG: helix-turn-helix transcriptional regulator [Bacteroidales bacterium]|nr:helix-turn-helix transcriptional regulator [Bacteroidales bacterium]